jgi:hypothetical protein
MLPQLLLTKRLFREGYEFSRRADSVSCGLAISLFQDAVEMYVWAVVKDRAIPVKDTFTFTGNLDAIEKAGISIPDRPKLLELNKARISFKHYGNLPAPDEAVKFRTYTEDFLVAATATHFNVSFADLSLVDLVSFPEVHERLKAAEAALSANDASKAITEASIAKALLFRHVDRHIPKVDHNLRDLDGAISKATELRGLRAFTYISQYLEALRELSVSTLLQVPLTDYSFLRGTLRSATQFGDGHWQVLDTKLVQPTSEVCRRAISILVEISIRMEKAV